MAQYYILVIHNDPKILSKYLIPKLALIMFVSERWLGMV